MNYWQAVLTLRHALVCVTKYLIVPSSLAHPSKGKDNVCSTIGTIEKDAAEWKESSNFLLFAPVYLL